MRKTPSEDVLVNPDRDTSSMPVEADLLFKADGNEGKLNRSVGRYNKDQEIPAVHFGLSRARVAGSESRGLTEIQARLTSTMLSVNSGEDLTGDNTVGEMWNGFSDELILPDGSDQRGIDLNLRMATPYRSYPVDFGDESDQNVGFVSETSTEARTRKMTVGEATLEVPVHRDERNQLGWEMAGIRFVGGNGRATDSRQVTGSLVASIPLKDYDPANIAVTPAQAIDAAHVVSPTSWHNRFAEAKIQTRGDYIRNNHRVLRDLAANMHQFQEYETTGLWARGFRSNLWTKQSVDELRVMGELMHLGESLMRGYPIPNRFSDKRFDSPRIGAVAQKLTRLHFWYNNNTKGRGVTSATLISELEAKYGLDSITKQDLETAAAAHASGYLYLEMQVLDHDFGYELVNTANNNTPGVHFTISDHGRDDNTSSSTALKFILAGRIGIDDNNQRNKYVYAEYDSITDLRAAQSTLSSAKGAKTFASENPASDVPEPTDVTGTAGLTETHYPIVHLSMNASVNPFFVALYDSQYGPMRMDSSHPLNEGRVPGIQTDHFFACIPGLESHISLAHVVEGELIQPESRDFKTEAFWVGFSWLFESDSTDPVGRHWGSSSKFIRALSPDFKSGATHDFLSKSAKTDSEVLRAAYLLGNTKIDDIKNRTNDPITSDSFIQKSSLSTTDFVTLSG
jgi:hypothetical protein